MYTELSFILLVYSANIWEVPAPLGVAVCSGPAISRCVSLSAQGGDACLLARWGGTAMTMTLFSFTLRF